MLAVRVITVALGLVALIVGVLSLLPVGWSVVAGVVLGVLGLAWGAPWLIRRARKPEPPHPET